MVGVSAALAARGIAENNNAAESRVLAERAWRLNILPPLNGEEFMCLIG
jgi:hypothetical protein